LAKGGWQFFANSLDALVLWCRYHAWLCTKSKGFAKVRWWLLDKHGEEPEFPHLPYRGYLVDDLKSLGLTASGVSGAVAISQTEIQAWAANTNVILYDLEAEWLVKMSAAYADEILRSNDQDTASPLPK
jgi:hypothetical protein